MATARDIITRALKRAQIIDATEQPSGQDAADGLAALNDMMHAWKNSEVDALQFDYTLNSTVVWFVPPKPKFTDLNAETRLNRTLHELAYQGTWDADANSPSLATATGTRGYVYKVSTAGSTALDDVASWAVNDFAVFDGENWLKGQSSAKHIRGLIAMLCVRLCEDYGKAPGQVVLSDADDGWRAILADYIIPGDQNFDTSVRRAPSQRWAGLV